MHTLAANSLRDLTSADQLAIRVFGQHNLSTLLDASADMLMRQVFSRHMGNEYILPSQLGGTTSPTFLVSGVNIVAFAHHMMG